MLERETYKESHLKIQARQQLWTNDSQDHLFFLKMRRGSRYRTVCTTRTKFDRSTATAREANTTYSKTTNNDPHDPEKD